MKFYNDDFLSYCTKILNSDDTSIAWDTYKQALTSIGFDRHIYISTHYRTYGLWGDPRDAIVLSSHEKNIMTHFLVMNWIFYNIILILIG